MNLKELAAQLHLSRTTVSRALNGHPEIKPATRERILAEAKRLNYAPSPEALRLARGQTGAFGLLLDMEHNLMRESLFRDFLVGLFDELAKSNRDLIVKPTRGDHAIEYERFYSRVDGFVISRPERSDKRVEFLCRKGIPFVLHGQTEVPGKYAFLNIDNGGAIGRLTNLLVDLGHHRIAMLNDETRYAFAHDRLLGFRAALAARGLKSDAALVSETRMDEANGHAVTARLLALPEPPTAIICGNVLIAQGTYRAIREKGLEPGRDISVVAHDDAGSEVNPDTFRPALTATLSSLSEAGQKVGTFLVALMNKVPPESLQEIWQPILVYRESAQPVKKRT